MIGKTVKQFKFKWWIYLICASIVIILFGIGCKFDFDISKALYFNNSTYKGGKFGSGLLVIIISFIGMSLGYLLIFSSIKCKDNKKKEVLGIIVGVILLITFVITEYSCFYDWNVFLEKKILLPLRIVLTILTVVGSFFLSYYVLRKRINNKTYWICILSILIVLIPAIIRVILIPIWSRPRPYRVFDAVNPIQEFKNLLQPQPWKTFKENFTSSLRSFPSGHVILGSIPLVLCLFVDKKHIKWLMPLCVIFQFAMATCRMVGGSHFLTDVTFSLFWVYTSIFFCQYLIKKCSI